MFMLLISMMLCVVSVVCFITAARLAQRGFAQLSEPLFVTELELVEQRQLQLISARATPSSSLQLEQAS